MAHLDCFDRIIVDRFEEMSILKSSATENKQVLL